MVFAPTTYFLPLVLSLVSFLGPVKPAKPGPAAPARVTALVSQHHPDQYLGRPWLVVTRRSPQRVQLLWNAVPECDIQGYSVERSLDGGHWHELAYVPVSLTHRYRYNDTTTTAAYYRVVRLDFARHCTFSLPKLVHSSRYAGPIIAQPNPAHGAVRLLGRDPSQPVDLLNSTGELVNQLSEASFSTQQLPRGVYALRQGNQITRLVVR